MKKTFKVLGIALLGMALAVACKNAPVEENNDTVPPVDTTVIDTLAEEPVVDAPVVDEPVKKATTKKQTKKDEPAPEKHDASKVTIQTNQGTATFGASGASVNTKGNDNKNDASKVTIKTDNGSATFGKAGMEIKKN